MIRETQEAVVAALLADAADAALVKGAVFAPHQPSDDAWPRHTIQAPQRIDTSTGCGVSADMIVTLHSWARGPDASLVAGELADAAVAALSQPLAIAGCRVSAWSFDGTRSVGDPDPSVEHLVSDIRYSVALTG